MPTQVPLPPYPTSSLPLSYPTLSLLQFSFPFQFQFLSNLFLFNLLHKSYFDNLSLFIRI